MHEVYKGNTFEGHTFLDVAKSFQNRHTETQPITVTVAAMLSSQNMQAFEAGGYHCIVGVPLANTAISFIHSIDNNAAREDGAMIRLQYPNHNYEVPTQISDIKKISINLISSLKKAEELVTPKEPGKRAKFIKKSGDIDLLYSFDEALKAKTKKLLRIKLLSGLFSIATARYM